MTDRLLSVLIKRGRKPHDFTAREGTKTRIEMVEPRVDQFHWNDLTINHPTDVLIGANVRALSVASDFQTVESE